MSDDLISRQALCDDLREYKVHPVPISSDESEVKGYNDGIDLAISVIAEFPSTEPERVAMVECIAEVYKDEIVDHYLSGICGICGENTYDRAKYCYECGAKLDWSLKEDYE